MLMTILKKARGTLGQFRFPPEFRITAPQVSSELTAAVRKLLNQLNTAVLEPPAEDEEALSPIADLARDLWRLRNIIQKLPEEPAEVDRLKRVLRSIWDALEASSIEVREHTGEDYDPGMALDVLSFQDDPSLKHETIIETIKPSIFVSGRLVRPGEVIVGKPS